VYRAVVVSIAAMMLASCGMLAESPAASDPCGIALARDESVESEALHACVARGDPDAETWLAGIYWTGGASTNSKPDPERERRLAEGRRLMESAARQGQREAQNEMGYAHLRGEYGVPVDYERAFAFFTAADRQGEPLASYNLAVMHYAGYGRPRSEEEADRLLWRSAAGGYKPALCTLAMLRDKNDAPHTAEIFRIAARALDQDGYACSFTYSEAVDEFR
jgi:TPR repeat protein